MSTNVGGVCEVLPPDLIELCEPSQDALVSKMKEVIDIVIKERDMGQTNRSWENHLRVKQFYTWPNVAKRTEKVYIEAMEKPVTNEVDRLKK